MWEMKAEREERKEETVKKEEGKTSNTETRSIDMSTSTTYPSSSPSPSPSPPSSPPPPSSSPSPTDDSNFIYEFLINGANRAMKNARGRHSTHSNKLTSVHPPYSDQAPEGRFLLLLLMLTCSL